MYTDARESSDFSDLYITYYPKLLRFAKEYVISEEDAENIVQDVFLKLWEMRRSLHLIENMNAYLFRLIKNRCLDHLKHMVSVEKYNKTTQNTFEMEMDLKLYSLNQFDENILSDENIESLVMDAINSLPEKCREIFILSKVDGLKYKEISARLGISTNTVENQVSIAPRKLRIKLKSYFPLLFFII